MKKIISIIIALIIMTGTVACAADYSENKGTINLDDFTVTGDGISVSGKTVTITRGGDFTVTGTKDDGMIYIDAADKVKLRLSGMSLTNTDGPAIWFENTEKALITITEGTENFLTDGTAYAETPTEAKACLFSNDDMEIKGNGTLTVTANYKHGIASDDDLKIENGTIDITSVKDGLKANNDVTVSGGVITISAGSQGIKAEQNIIIDGGEINVLKSEEGFEAELSVTFNGGITNITASDDGVNSGGSSSTDTETVQPQMPQGGRGNRGEMMPPEGFTPPEGGFENMVPPSGDAPQMPQGGRGNRGEMMPPADGNAPQLPQGGGGNRGDMMPSEGFPRPEGGFENMTPPEGFTRPEGGRGGMGGFGMMSTTPTDHDIVINGGTIRINASGDGLDSNGIIIQNGGTVYINGPENNGNGAIDGNGYLINGGEMIATGASGMAMSGSNGSVQGSLNFRFSNQNAGTLLALKDSSGNTIMEFTPEKRFSSLVYSSEKLILNETYTLFGNDTELATITMTSLQASGGNFGGGFENRGQIEKKPGRENQSQRKEISVFKNGKKMEFDAKPVLSNSTTLVPMRAIFEAFGMEVSWNDESKTVTATKGDLTVTLTIGSTSARKNDETITLNTAPVISEQRTMVPVRFIAESLGLTVSWDGLLSQVNIDGEV